MFKRLLAGLGFGPATPAPAHSEPAPDWVAVNELYDLIMVPQQAFSGAGNHNLGWWEPNTDSQDAASHNLYRQVFEQIPNAQRGGRYLELACGLGANARFLSAQVGAENLVSTNISEVQLEVARGLAPGVHFELMSATDLRYPEASFDHVVCIEAAPHFDTRVDFFRESFKVLRPGGWLVFCDILSPAAGDRMWFGEPSGTIPAANHFDGPWPERLARHRAQLASAGFVEVRNVDVTERCTRGHLRYVRGLIADDARLAALTDGSPTAILNARQQYGAYCERMEQEQGWMPYVLAAARKPEAQ